MARLKGRAFLKLGLLLALLVAVLLAVRFTPLGDLLSREGVGGAVQELRGSTLAPLIFICIYTVATALAIPGTVLTLAGGALFGAVHGSIYNLIAANLGANIAFGIARFLGRDAVESLAGDRLSRLDRATREHGFRGLLTLRLIPLVPFNALNFGSGLTAISWRAYALATLVGILPGTIVYTTFADGLLAGSQEASREALLQVSISGAVLIFLAFLPTLLKKLHVKLPGSTPLVVALLALSPLACDRPQGGTGDAAASGESVEAPGVSEERGVSGDPGVRSASPEGLPQHERFTRVLEVVVRDGDVAYPLLRERRHLLDDYLQRLASTSTEALADAPPEAQLAFWINAYNACMLKLVVDHYPLDEAGGFLNRLKNRVAGRPANSVWQIPEVFTREHCRVAGAARSQDGIEHEIVRPMGEPRIHFAINCAARSCPPLTSRAYVPEELDDQLERQVERFMADPRHFRLGTEEGEPVLRVNRVLDWFGEDFGGPEGVATFFASRAEGPEAEQLRDPDLQVEFMDYDWTLNDAGA